MERVNDRVIRLTRTDHTVRRGHKPGLTGSVGGRGLKVGVVGLTGMWGHETLCFRGLGTR